MHEISEFEQVATDLKGRGGEGKDHTDLHSLQLEHECFCPRFQVNPWDWPPIEGPWL